MYYKVASKSTPVQVFHKLGLDWFPPVRTHLFIWGGTMRPDWLNCAPYMHQLIILVWEPFDCENALLSFMFICVSLFGQMWSFDLWAGTIIPWAYLLLAIPTYFGVLETTSTQLWSWRFRSANYHV